jgi:hypothetical protein
LLFFHRTIMQRTWGGKSWLIVQGKTDITLYL